MMRRSTELAVKDLIDNTTEFYLSFLMFTTKQFFRCISKIIDFFNHKFFQIFFLTSRYELIKVLPHRRLSFLSRLKRHIHLPLFLGRNFERWVRLTRGVSQTVRIATQKLLSTMHGWLEDCFFFLSITDIWETRFELRRVVELITRS